MTNETRIVAAQDAEPTTDFNKLQFNNHYGRWGDGLEKVASIPMVLYMELKQKGILNDPVAMKKWLNDPDNRYFRTRPGTI